MHLSCQVAATASVLFDRCSQWLGSHGHLPLDQADDLSIDERIKAGDRTAIYDAIVEAIAGLEAVRNQAAEIAAGDPAAMERLRELQEIKRRDGCKASICSSRWFRQETAGSEASGKERQRSRTDRSRRVSHG